MRLRNVGVGGSPVVTATGAVVEPKVVVPVVKTVVEVDSVEFVTTLKV